MPAWILRHLDSIFCAVFVLVVGNWLRNKPQALRYKVSAALGLFALVCFTALYLTR